MTTDDYDRESYTKAWGKNVPVIVGGVRDEFRLPLLPPRYDWLLTRETKGGKPTYRLALLHDAHTDEGFEVITRREIDKTTHGNAGVVQVAQLIKERHCPQRSTTSSKTTPETS